MEPKKKKDEDPGTASLELTERNSLLEQSARGYVTPIAPRWIKEAPNVNKIKLTNTAISKPRLVFYFARA